MALKQLSAKIKTDYFELKRNHEEAEERQAKQIVRQAMKERIKELDKQKVKWKT